MLNTVNILSLKSPPGTLKTFIFVLKYEQNKGFEPLDTQNGVLELTIAS